MGKQEGVEVEIGTALISGTIIAGYVILSAIYIRLGSILDELRHRPDE